MTNEQEWNEYYHLSEVYWDRCREAELSFVSLPPRPVMPTGQPPELSDDNQHLGCQNWPNCDTEGCGPE